MPQKVWIKPHQIDSIEQRWFRLDLRRLELEDEGLDDEGREDVEDDDDADTVEREEK